MEGFRAAAHLRRKCLVSDAPNKVMKTLGPEGICPYIESLINMCIPSLRVSSSFSSLFPPPRPHFPLLIPRHLPSVPVASSRPLPLITAPLLLKLGVLARKLGGRVGVNVGHQQHGKQTTCFLPRSRVVNVYRNRSGQPCG